MWLFLPFGFFSAVFVKTVDGKPDLIGGVFPDGAIMVRARKRAHLEELLNRTGDTAPIVEQYGSDYAYRIFLSRERWTEIVARFSMDINYSNFKNEAKKQSGTDYEHALHRIWSTMYALQTPSAERYIFDQDFDQSRNYFDEEDEDEIKRQAWDEYDRWEAQLSQSKVRHE